NGMVREAVASGVAPEDAIVLATVNPATWHRLWHLGAIAPGYQADMLLLPDLQRFDPEVTLKSGRPVEEIPEPDVPEWVKHAARSHRRSRTTRTTSSLSGWTRTTWHVLSRDSASSAAASWSSTAVTSPRSCRFRSPACSPMHRSPT